MLSVSYELDLWGRNRSGVRAAESSLQATVFDRDTARLTLISGVAAGYFEVLSLRSRLAIARENLAIAERVLELVSARVAQRRRLGARRIAPAGDRAFAARGAPAARTAGASDARRARRAHGPHARRDST